MAAVKGKDTKPEIIVRKYLFSRGLQYSVNNRKLPGSPEIVLKKYKTDVFVDGCFWHENEKSMIGLSAQLSYIKQLIDNQSK